MKAEASPNIAFIKYWGKLPAKSDAERNLGANPSLSLTLSRAKTTTLVEAVKAAESVEVELELNGKPASEGDELKVRAHIQRIVTQFGAEPQRFRVQTANNFPTGVGIASSASGFAALTVAAAGEILGRDKTEKMLREDSPLLVELARRGSGSACRSLAGPFVKWEGRVAQRMNIDWPLRDTILILTKDHKSVPSSEGHTRAPTSPHFEARQKRLPARLAAVEAALAARDLGRLGPLLEEEALDMHEVAGTTMPPTDYLLPETRKLLKLFAESRQRDFYFTLDAGPNFHIISEKPVTKDLERFLDKAGVKAETWEDSWGRGATLLPEGA